MYGEGGRSEPGEHDDDCAAANKFSFLLLKKSFELKYQGSMSVVSTFGLLVVLHRFPFSLKW